MESPEPRTRTEAAADGYRKLVTRLAGRAARMGARDPEAAAQEAVRRSLVHPLSQRALVYYFGEHPLPSSEPVPSWTLLQLVGWLHGVLKYVVLEEHSRARREIATPEDDMPQIVDPATSPLEQLIDDEEHAAVREALSALNPDHRSALLLRFRGVKYSEIAVRLGVNENTVATWVRRGSRAVVDYVRERIGAGIAADARSGANSSSGSNG